MREVNYYYNDQHPLRPWVATSVANEGSIAPVNALRIRPDEKDGFHPCEKDGEWVLIEDHRGETVYHKETAKPMVIEDIGEIHVDYTAIKPDVEFPKWNGKKWVTDLSEKAKWDEQSDIDKRSYLMAEATVIIDPLNDAVDFGDATDDDVIRLKKWKKYRIELSRINPANGKVEIWPVKPE